MTSGSESRRDEPRRTCGRLAAFAEVVDGGAADAEAMGGFLWADQCGCAFGDGAEAGGHLRGLAARGQQKSQDWTGGQGRSALRQRAQVRGMIRNGTETDDPGARRARTP